MPEDATLDAYTEGPLPPPKRTQRKHKAHTYTKEEQEERASKTRDTQDADLDEYCARWDWDAPGMKCKLTRMSPRIHNNIQIAGHLESREGGGYTLDEIRDRFGGGTYRINISGFSEKQGTIRPISKKIFEVGGPPRVDQVPTHVQAASSGTSGRSQEELASNAQGALVNLVSRSMERAYEGQRGGDANPDLFREMRETVEASAKDQVMAIREAAAQENKVLRDQLNELRQVAEELRAELRTKEQATDHAVNSARMESSGLLQTLLPTFSEQASQRAQAAVQDASERVARMQDQFARDMAAAEQRFAMQIENMKTMYQSQTMNQQTMFDGRVQQLTAEIALLRQRCETLEADNRAMQQRNTELLIEQTKKTDPLNMMQQAATLREAADGLFGGSGGGGDGLSEDASDAMRLIHTFGQSLGSLAPVIAAKMGMGGAPVQQEAMPQAMPQQRQAPPRLVMPRQITPQGPQQQPAPRPAAPQRPKTRLRKQDLIAGVRLLNAALSTGTKASVVADTAAQTMDRPMLNELVRRTPAAVYTSLQSAGILDGPLATAKGSDYLAEFLGALKERLGVGLQKPEAPKQEAPPAKAEEAPQDNEQPDQEEH